jgi:hypothetical protein
MEVVGHRHSIEVFINLQTIKELPHVQIERLIT